MCGIVGFAANENTTAEVFKGLLKLEYRGYDSAGIAVINEGRIKCEKVAGRVSELKDAAEGLFGKVSIGHTRWATHGAATRSNAHPHISYDGRFALVHNGIIENSVELKAELTGLGIEFKSETDSEVIVQLIAKNYFGDPIKALDAAVKRLSGSFAIALICTDFPLSVFAAKKGSPLIAGRGRNRNMLASDVSALSPFAKSICRLSDGELLEIRKDTLNFFRDGKPVEKEFEEIKMKEYKVDKGEFEHFMIKEIFDQPEVAKSIIEKRIRNGEAVFSELEPDILTDIKQVSIVACGSAYNAGMAGKYILKELLRLPVTVSLASEYRYAAPLPLEGTLTVFISQSGETADTLAAAERVRALRGRSISIVNVRDSALTKLTDYTLYTEAGPEVAVATTKGYTAQVMTLCLLGVWAKRNEKSVLFEAVEAIKSIPEIMLRCLGTKDKAEELAKKVKDETSVYFIGRNIDYAVALEAALKLKEISYIHSEAFAAGELKHGSIALIEEGTKVFALNCYGPLTDKTVSAIREVKARGACVTAAFCENDGNTAAVCDEGIPLPIVHPIVGAVCEIIPFQLLAYFTAKYRGADIDKPRNLAKSVTVE